MLGRGAHEQHAIQQHGHWLEKHGTAEEVAAATRRLVEVLDVVAVSGPSPDRGQSVLVRVYLEVRTDPTPPTTSGPPPARPARRQRGQLP
jgi:hypothetical protein